MWFKLKALFAHSRTILAARLYSFLGAVVAIHDTVGAFVAGHDFTPLTTRVLDLLHVPPDLRSLVLGVFVASTGGLFEWLRRITTQSLAENKTDSVVAAVAADAGVTSPPAPSETLKP